MTTPEQIAAMLLQAGAVKLSPHQPFTWASGWKSPIYCDNRLTLSYPLIRRLIRDKLAEATLAHFPQAEAVAGVATAGVPQGALLADVLGLPFLYVRPKPKDHGLENLIEGKTVPGQQVVLVEDLISTGGSSLKAAKAVQDAGMRVCGMLATFTYGFAVASEAFAAADVPLVALCDYPALVQVALAQHLVTAGELASLQAWRNDPATWGK
jgi:orotate phosphoribosyltransferase